MKLEDAAKFTRQNTGRHFLDSGDYYGRKYEEPLPKQTCYFSKYGDPCLSLTHVIAEFNEFHDLHDEFYGDVEADLSRATFEDVVEFMRDRQYREVSHDNTYNYGGDLDQEAMYQVFVPEDQSGDEWYYNVDSVLVVYSHNGCDLRGGYADPMFLESNGNAEVPFVISTHASLYSPDLDEFENERLYSGYSHYAMGELERMGYDWVEVNEDGSGTFKGPNGLITVHVDYYP